MPLAKTRNHGEKQEFAEVAEAGYWNEAAAEAAEKRTTACEQDLDDEGPEGGASQMGRVPDVSSTCSN